MRKLKPKYLAIAAAIAAAAIAFGLYQRYGSDTRVAFVNYPEYILAPLLDQEINPAIRAEPVKWTEKSGEELKNYDCIIFFGMGLNFTEKQQELLSRLRKPIYTTASTRRETALNTLTEKQLDTLQKYLGGGKENFRRMLDFIRYDVDGKRINAPKPEPPKEVERRPFFHVREDDAFKTYKEYLAWYKKTGRYRENASTVCILSGNGGGALEELIGALEKKGLNVVAANGMWNIEPIFEEVAPDLVIYQPHGRLGEKAVELLKKYNVPLFCPIKVSQPYEEYLRDQRGMTGGMLSQSVTMPELDGGAVPFVLSALFRNKRGLQEFRTIPDRLERFAELVKKTTDLKRKPNSEKKIAIVYYGSIGKEAATGGLGVSESVLNVLKRLRQEGFTTGPLPENAEELNREIEAGNAAFGTNAGNAEAEKNAPRIRTVTITPGEYHAWIKKSMPADLYQTVTERYGEFPGKSFRTPEGNMAIGRIQFGNVILMPQSLPGEGGDESKLVHGVKMAPPHTYIATYLYIRHGFNADAMMHFGTHGSLEFTPWKQVALSSYDWPDVLVGEMPHYYLYIINNVGEAQIAKRRSYATMVSHLTAPFMQADGYGAITQLHEKLENYEAAENAMLKAEYAGTIVELATKEHYDRDLKLSPDFAAGKLNEEDLGKLHNFLHEIQDSKVNRGMYVIGRPYSEEEANETARLMTVDAIADALFKADLEAGKVKEEQRKDLHFFTENYLSKAHARAKEALVNPDKFKKSAPARPAGHGGAASGEEMRKMMQTGKLPDGRGIPPEMAAMMQQRGSRKNGREGGAPPRGTGMGGMRQSAPKAEPQPEEITFRAKADLLKSTEAELASLVNAFSGGYLYPSPGGDPVLNPDTVPTGRNLYGIDPERTPTRESYAVGKQLAEALISEKLKTTGEYPKKVGFSLWGGEFIRTQGTNIGEIFYLLGVEPIWDSRGRVQDVRLIPMSELKRPRIDVVVQTSGQFRGAATSRMRLIDKAVRLAATDPDGEFGNFVREGSLEIIRALIARGMSPEEAKSFSNARLFGGVNGNFGTGVTGMVQNSGNWEDTKGIAELYLNNMGALYTEEHWGEHVDGVFKAALVNTDTVVQSRSSNSWGPLSLDHVYEFTGGLSLAARHVTGKDPGAYFNDLRTPGRPRVQEAGEAAMVEARSTVLNPKYIKEMMKEGASATGSFVEVFHNTFGWEVMKPDMLEDHLWQEYKEVYVDDKLNLDVRKYFEENNPAALQEMTAVMLETVRKGYWKADAETVRQIAETHVELMKKFDLPPTRNEKLREMIKEQLKDPELRREYEKQIAKTLERQRQLAEERKKAEEVSGQRLKEESIEQPKQDEGSNRAAMRVILGIIIVALLAIILGHRRRKNAI
ncbi:MAG: cobaltochelatase subunit CobN [Lentisphaeria bacterium]|nr:cobaltochelatase subunit CobN [Lentisphaeria bacterium]